MNYSLCGKGHRLVHTRSDVNMHRRALREVGEESDAWEPEGIRQLECVLTW